MGPVPPPQPPGSAVVAPTHLSAASKSQNQTKKPRLVFTDLQRRTLQAIFKETKRPSKEMQIAISQQLGLELSTVGNFFMNARRRSQDKWLDDSEQQLKRDRQTQDQQSQQGVGAHHGKSPGLHHGSSNHVSQGPVVSLSLSAIALPLSTIANLSSLNISIAQIQGTATSPSLPSPTTTCNSNDSNS